MSVWIIFVVALAVVFSIMMLVTSPGAQVTGVSRRLQDVVKSQLNSLTHDAKNESLLVTRQESSELLRLVVRNTGFADFLQKLLIQSHVKLSARITAEIMGALACVAYALGWYFSHDLPLACVAASAAGMLPIAFLYHRRKQWVTHFNSVLPECIDTFARSLRAGHSVVAAFDIVSQQVPAPANAEFADVFKKQRYGLPLKDALYQMIERVPSMDLKIMITAVLVQRETGGNLPNVLDRLVAVIRDRLRIQRDIRIHTAQGRLTGWILGLLPPFLMLAVNWISPNYSSSFVHEQTGRYMLYTCIGLLTIGVFTINRIVHGIEV